MTEEAPSATTLLDATSDPVPLVESNGECGLAAETPVADVADQSNPQGESNNDGDDFGDFGSAKPVTESTSQTTAGALTQVERLGEVGAPGAPATIEQSDPSKEDEGNNNNGINGFGDTETDIPVVDATGQSRPNNGSNDGVLGDFGSAEPPTESTVEATSDTAVQVESAAEFGGFSATEAPAAPAQSEPSKEDNNTDDDTDFGDFGSAEHATESVVEGTSIVMPQLETAGVCVKPGAAEVPAAPDLTGLSDEDRGNNNNYNDDDDDFGDFGSAEPATEAKDGISDTMPHLETIDALDEPGAVEVPAAPDQYDPSNEDGGNNNNNNDDTDFGGAEPVVETALESSSDATPQSELTNEFDAFGVVETNTPIADVADKCTPDNKSIDGDDCGDFGGAESVAETTSDSTSDVVPQPKITNELVGFGVVETNTPVTEVTEVTDKSTTDNDDDFGDFGGSAEPVVEATSDSISDAVPQVESAVEVDGVGGAETPAAGVAHSSGPDNESNDDDDFGDFGSAEPLEEGTSGTAAQLESADGGFVATIAPTQNEPSISHNYANDDDFGDFGSAEPVVAAAEDAVSTMENVPAGGAAEKIEMNGNAGGLALAEASLGTPPERIDSTAEDDVGDFGSSEPSPSLSKPEIENKLTEDSFGDFNTIPAESAKEAEDDFGDFGGASEPISEVETNLADDSFGDFNNVPSSTGEPTKEEEDEDDDDDFGEFDSAPNEVPVIQSKATEDSFGDFNDMQSDSANATDNFGDFDSAAASHPVKSPDDTDSGDFGNFSSFGDSPPEPAPAPAPVPARPIAESSSPGFATNFSTQTVPALPLEADDPTLLKATTVFSKLFQGFPSGYMDGDDGSSGDAIAVEVLTSLIVKQQGGDDSVKPMEQLLAVLKGIERDPPPSVYILSEGENDSPNAHFSVNLQGEPEPEDDNATRRKFEQGPQSQGRQATDTGVGQSAAGTAPTTSSSPTVEKADRKQSIKCRTLLQQIPDLSFMLLSKLSLPSSQK